jgi:DNA mismatch endonuclease (patch repair protein)
MPREHYPTDEATSRRMSAVRPLDTAPERIVRRLLTELGCRYRLHRYDLPGRPDVVMPGRRRLVFVHGCFWHRHAGCPRATMPARNEELWRDKFQRTKRRDALHRRDLEAAGWKVLVVWECETSDPGRLSRRLREWLHDD